MRMQLPTMTMQAFPNQQGAACTPLNRMQLTRISREMSLRLRHKPPPGDHYPGVPSQLGWMGLGAPTHSGGAYCVGRCHASFHPALPV
jgi:hypothetical protein